MPTQSIAENSLTKPPLSPLSTPTCAPNEHHWPWLPISLLAVTTAALIFPAVLLRRVKTTNVNTSVSVAYLSDPSAPPRRVGTGPGRVLGLGPVVGTGIGTPKIRRPALNLGSGSPHGSSPGGSGRRDGSGSGIGDDFNPALYTVKAFGLATLLVGVGAVTGVWGVKWGLDVHDMREFGDRMRDVVSTKLPVLSSRIHRALDVDSDADTDMDGGWLFESQDGDG